jgi:hypothetical protein
MRDKFDDVDVAHLVTEFETVCVRQDEAEKNSNSSKYNKLYLQMKQIEGQLKSCSGDQRRALLPLLNHRNAQVRLMASVAMLAIDKQSARQALQIISDRSEYPQAITARGMLRAIDEGRYIPT